MPYLNVLYPALQTSDADVQPMLTLVGSAGTVVTVPFAPMPTDMSNLAGTWTQLDRAARSPLLLYGGTGLPQLSWVLELAQLDYEQDVEDYINGLRAAAQSSERWIVNYGPQEKGLWRITDLKVQITGRQPVTQAATRAQATVTLTATGAIYGVGPLTGGVGPSTAPVVMPPPPAPAPVPPPPAPPPAPSPAAAPAAPPPTARTYTVVRGDTLWALATRFYGDPLRWRWLADRNGIRDPRLLQIGTVLYLT